MGQTNGRRREKVGNLSTHNALAKGGASKAKPKAAAPVMKASVHYLIYGGFGRRARSKGDEVPLEIAFIEVYVYL